MPVDIDTQVPQQEKETLVEHNTMLEGQAFVLPCDTEKKMSPMQVIDAQGEQITIEPVAILRVPIPQVDSDEDKIVSTAVLMQGPDSKGSLGHVHTLRLSDDETPKVEAFEEFELVQHENEKPRLSSKNFIGSTQVDVKPVPTDQIGNEWKIGVTVGRRHDEPAEVDVITPEDSDAVFSGKSISEYYGGFERRKNLRERARRWGRRIIIAAGVYSSIASGGLIDKVADPVQDARSHVETVIPEPVLLEKLDGIPLDKFDQDVQQEKRQDLENQKEARENLAQTMESLDSHQTEAIHSKAEQFRAEHASELFDAHKSEELISRIGDADSIESVIKDFEKFLDFYGLELEFNQNDLSDVDLSITKAYLQDIVRAMAPLPSSLVKYGLGSTRDGQPSFVGVSLKTMSDMNSDSSRSSNTEGFVAAKYSTSSRIITVGIPNKTIDVISRAQSNLVPSSVTDSSSYKTTFLHELGHSFHHDHGQTVKSEQNVIAEIPSFFARSVAGVPEHQSIYGQAGGYEENRAEAYSIILDPDQGPSHPDQTREFVSKANEDRLKLLYEIETKYPGFTEHMVDLGLIDRQVFDIH